MKRSASKKGFTLIEVTLAIVIGIVMIAGATLIYNQAKNSAGNSRAQAKAASLQSLVEQYMARADGIAPEPDVIRALWERARPDDFNKSPWGGKNAPDTQSAINTRGVLNGLDGCGFAADGTTTGGCTMDKILSTGAVVDLTNSTAPSGVVEGTGHVGMLIYYKFQNANPYFIWDENKRTVAAAKTYSVATTNQQGQRWFFVRGNAAGVAGDNPFGLRGQIQN